MYTESHRETIQFICGRTTFLSSQVRPKKFDVIADCAGSLTCMTGREVQIQRVLPVRGVPHTNVCILEIFLSFTGSTVLNSKILVS